MLCFAVLINIAKAQYLADVLGNNIEFQTIQMPADASDSIVCTIVRKQASSKTNRAVLYVHGFCDYFFNVEMAEKFTAQGIDFYAVDLRKYGRSLLPGQMPNICRNLSEYFADIDTCLSIIKTEGHTDVSIIAHSTGGLTTALYADAKPNNPLYQRIILNSPFLDMNQSWFMENIVVPVVSFLGRFFPNMPLPKGLAGWYGQSIHKDFKGEWDYNLTWKPIEAFQMDAGWLHAIHQGHKKVQKGLNIDKPILLMHSDKTVVSETWTEDYRIGDGVLDVEDIHTYGLKLGKDVQESTIKAGLHDLSLSSKDIRENYYQAIFEWLGSKTK